MHLVGARFDDLSAAEEALVELRERIVLEAGDVGLRPLGSLRYERPASGLVLAGRFEHDDVEEVVEIMRRHGGVIVFKRAEWRIPRSHSRPGDRSGDRASWLSRLRR
jgi:hypothetical protein